MTEANKNATPPESIPSNSHTFIDDVPPARLKIRCTHYGMTEKVKRRERYMVRVCPSCNTLFAGMPRQSGERIVWKWMEVSNG